MVFRISERAGRRATRFGAAFVRLPLALAMAAPLSCEASSSPRPGEPGAGSICPDCVAGGETTDFSGDVSCSTRSLTPVQRDSAIAREFDADAVIARLERPLLTSFGWRRGPGGSVATGYERETQAQIRVEVQGVAHGELESVSNGEPCGDYLRLDARVQLSTRDGSLSGSFERPFRVWRGSSVAYLNALGIEDSEAPIDLREFSGSLDLKLDPAREHAGAVALSLAVGPDAAFGSLFVEVQYLDVPDTARARVSPLRAQWPSEGCDADWAPVELDAAINPSDGRSARDYWARRRDRLPQVYPAPATWKDGSTTEIVLELGDPERACQSRGGPSSYYVTAPIHIRTADQRLVAAQPARVHFRTDEDTDHAIEVDGEPTARAAFLEQLSAPDLDLASDLDARFQLYSRNPPDAAPSGAIQITGFDGERHNRLYLNWCTESACNNLPRPGPN